MQTAAKTLTAESPAAPHNAEQNAAVQFIVDHEPQFLTSMDRIVKLLEGEAAAELGRLRALAMAISIAILGLLASLGALVVRPATAAIRRQVDELEARVAQRTRELDDALATLRDEIHEREETESRNRSLAAQLAHADRVHALGRLAAGLAHELNQPLGAIANYAEACDATLAGPLDEEASVRLCSHVRHLKQASLRAGGIVRRIRNFVRPGAASAAPVDMAALVAEVVDLCRVEADRMDVEIALELPPADALVHADAIQIQQVLVNLVQNALQSMAAAAPQRRRLTIRLSAANQGVQVDVLDSGAGPAKPTPRSCSSRSTRPRPTASASGCRSAVRSSRTTKAQSGRNHSRKAPSSRLLSRPSPRRRPTMLPHPPANPTVFVVDDDRQMRQSVVALLEALRFSVHAFGAAGAFHRYYRPDMHGCLLLDIRMPRQSGLELYEQLLHEGKRIPVIFMTAHADVTTAVAAMKTGAIEFLEKPFDGETLADRIHKAFTLDAQWRRQDAEFAALNARIERLTDREQETLKLIQAGDTNKAIASKLAITERAVEMRRSAIMRKLQVRSAAEVIEMSATHRILADLRRAAAERLRL
jgi:FixJ family two-component response regulator/signal transduction histidine kinase